MIRVVVVAVAVLGWAALGAGSAMAAPGNEQIDGYAVAMTLQRDGSMQVTETIKYDFASATDKHGIWRKIPTKFAYDDKRDREYPIDQVKVTSPSGAPNRTSLETGAVTSIKVGDSDKLVHGVQTYVIRYDVRGVINTFGDHQELYWNAIGNEWDVPIVAPSATVTGPAGVAATKVACFEGVQGSTDTCQAAIGGNGVASFGATQLPSDTGMTVVASFPPGTFPNAAPILKERWTPQHAFSPAPAQSGSAVVLLALLGGGAIALASRRGRDQRYLGITPGLEPSYEGQARVSRVPWLRRDPIAVQFTPPPGMRPGQLGTLIDEQANVVDVTATIIDLAVRGFLRIEEVEDDPGQFRSGDWRLVELPDAPVAELYDYETKLYNAIFTGRAEVLLSDLKETFKSDLESVQSMLYDDVTRAGWFQGNPSSVRSRWAVYGVLLTVVGVGLTWLLAALTSFGLAGVAVSVSGLVLLVLSPRMPARTAKGTALLAQARGFRLYLEKAEADQIRFEEGQDIFSRYLPYAIVFGVAERWAKVFAALAARGVAVGVPSWYVGSLYANGLFNYGGFGSSMNDFSTTTSGSLAAATPSSSGASGFGGGGFSGGGGGGGGGGSW